MKKVRDNVLVRCLFIELANLGMLVGALRLRAEQFRPTSVRDANALMVAASILEAQGDSVRELLRHNADGAYAALGEYLAEAAVDLRRATMTSLDGSGKKSKRRKPQVSIVPKTPRKPRADPT